MAVYPQRSRTLETNEQTKEIGDNTRWKTTKKQMGKGEAQAPEESLHERCLVTLGGYAGLEGKERGKGKKGERERKGKGKGGVISLRKSPDEWCVVALGGYAGMREWG